MSLLVDYCPKCGTIFQKNLRNLCASCSSQTDRSLNLCLDRLWTRPKSTTQELSDATGVSISELHAFIKSGRLPSSYPNLTYPCESCGHETRSGRLCSSCIGVFREAGKAQPDSKAPVRQIIVKSTTKVMYTSRQR
ncbi:hypothetical protein [Saccharibacillus alkalitolerans]|uniref:Flagellar protein n=1 Tax=Saccharibacillus alkalitolerans TaxID=2705290 RepID=A0ABX0F410_9BACL|nr:hypothetical protein [Saccharibacillus alkalitolerans]NGZ74339.1 hypothetical protein [Saccharibacillus alkalitolerans]